MDKAIAILKMMATNENLTGVYHNEANQAIAELTTHKAKIDELKEYCKNKILNTQKESLEAVVFIDTYTDILQKLEELDICEVIPNKR